MIGIFVAIFVGGVVGWLAERFRLSFLGYPVAVGLGVGGAVLLLFAQMIFGVHLGFGRGLTAAIGAAALIFIANQRR